MRESIFIGFVWLALGVFLAIASTSYDLGEFLAPGPGAYPLLLGILMIVLSLTLILTGRLPGKSPSQANTAPSARSPGWSRVALIILILTSAAVCFELIGYLFTFFLMILCLMVVGSTRSWRQIFVASFLSTLGVYLVFVLLLKQHLPTGPLGF